MSPRITLVAFGDPYRLPPTLNAARLLAQRGWQVDLLGARFRGQPPLADSLPAEVATRTDLEIGTGPRQVAAWARFIAAGLRLARRERPSWIYAYDCMAAPVGRWMARVSGARLVYHCHDSARPEAMARTQRWLRIKRHELAAARAADLVVFPQADRARHFAEEAGLARPPEIVFNCPPRDWLGDEQRVDPDTAAHRRRWPRLVIYQGLNAARGVRELIDSMGWWPEDAGLVLLGDLASRGVPAAQAHARARGVSERILWRSLLPYHEVATVCRVATLGVLITPGTDYNLRHLAGASNKVFEYMACGLPVLVPSTAGWDALIEAPGHGEVCRDPSPAALGAQIARILDDQPRRALVSARNRQAFLDRYNYEAQFEPVARVLEDGCRPPLRAST
jgi:glycosyltransferase involved in cell wall biosynthesis